MTPRCVIALMFSAALAFPFAAFADTVTVVTSFPKELTSAYKKAFEAKYPGDRLEILNNIEAPRKAVRQPTSARRW